MFRHFGIGIASGKEVDGCRVPIAACENNEYHWPSMEILNRIAQL
jgi:hypothetical protein